MPNGKIGDHPLTDILVHGRRVYSDQVDSLIRKIVDRGGRDRIDLLLFTEFNPFNKPDIAKLERVLREICDDLKGTELPWSRRGVTTHEA
jgi:hypothetical protein